MTEQISRTKAKARVAYAAKISAAWQQSVAAIISTGTLLIEAKRELGHGLWEEMFQGENRLPFGLRTAERLMAIAGNGFLANPTHVSILPPSWGTLYELSRLPKRTLSLGVRDGLITADMTREDVRKRFYVREEPSPEVQAEIDKLGRQAEVVGVKNEHKGIQRKRREYLNKHQRQVADYLDALGMYETALKVAIACRERFSDPNAVRFIAQRHARVIKLMAKMVGPELAEQMMKDLRAELEPLQGSEANETIVVH